MFVKADLLHNTNVCSLACVSSSTSMLTALGLDWTPSRYVISGRRFHRDGSYFHNNITILAQNIVLEWLKNYSVLHI